jgi:hypothetical protein
MDEVHTYSFSGFGFVVLSAGAVSAVSDADILPAVLVLFVFD